MKTITYLILFHFLLFILFNSSFHTYALENDSIDPFEATIEAELSPEIQPPIDNPTATDEALLEATPEAALIETEIAITEITEETEINTNVTGINNCFVLLNLYKNPDSSLDLANIVPTDCNDHTEATDESKLDITQENEATIQNTIHAHTNTGENVSQNGIDIITGDATTSAYISTLANTNIVGSNTLFGVLNIFSPTSQDIVLPYELAFLESEATESLPIGAFTNTNSSIIKHNINANANTGNNEGGTIQTGNSAVLIRVADTANTNIFQSGFFVLQLNVLAPWSGTVQNFNGNSIQPIQNTLLNQQNSLTVSNTNTAVIENNLDLKANTGSNTTSQNDISTGNATIKAYISTIANTNIVGNNWYHMIVNIFDKFEGDIIFPRPDLITGTFSKAIEGGEVEITVKYGNGGSYKAHDVQIQTHLPPHVTLQNESDGAQIDGSRIYWNIGTLEKNQIGARTFRIKLETAGIYTISTSISTRTDEPHTQNNGSQATITVKQPAIVTSTPPNQNSLMKPIPHVSYNRILQPTPQVTKTVVNKLYPNQLRSTPGQTRSLSSVRKPFFVYTFYAIITSIEGRIAQLARALH